MWWLYRAVAATALILVAPWLFLSRRHHYGATLRGRLGRTPIPPPGPAPLWIHAVSVGEVGVARTLIQALPADLPLVVTTTTPTGQARAQEDLAKLDRPISVSYFPIELESVVRRFFDHFSPRGLILIEGDFWPLVLRQAVRRGVPIGVVNGRVGDRSFRRWSTVPRLARAFHSMVDRFGVQTDEDRRRWLALGIGADRVQVLGNLKYEMPEPPETPELAQWVNTLSAGRPTLVAGSTMAGEDEQVLEAFRRLGGGERALLILAPRHPERWNDVAALLERQEWSTWRRSAAKGDRQEQEARPARTDVVLLDSLGELAGLYRYATAAFIGGTLVGTGGHNPLEALRFGVPVVCGPSMENFRHMAEDLDQAGAWARVAGPQELANTWHSWLEDPTAAHQMAEIGRRRVLANRGALGRTRDFVKLLCLKNGAKTASQEPEDIDEPKVLT